MRSARAGRPRSSHSRRHVNRVGNACEWPEKHSPGVFRANAPQVYRGATTPDAGQVVTVQELQTEQPKATSLGDDKWAEVFRDPALQQLIREGC
jgi:hypothetical protein